MSVKGTTESLSLAGPSQQIVLDHSQDGCVTIGIWFPGHFDSCGPLLSQVLLDLTFWGIFRRIAVGMGQVGSIEDKNFWRTDICDSRLSRGKSRWQLNCFSGVLVSFLEILQIDKSCMNDELSKHHTKKHNYSYPPFISKVTQFKKILWISYE